MTAGGDRHAGSHVNQIVILVRIKRKGSSELVQPGEDFFKIPGIFETKRVQMQFGFRVTPRVSLAASSASSKCRGSCKRSKR